jgi:hypothetical protein
LSHRDRLVIISGRIKKYKSQGSVKE